MTLTWKHWQAITSASSLDEVNAIVDAALRDRRIETSKGIPVQRHAFVGGYEIDPSQPNRCQICGLPSGDHTKPTGGGTLNDEGQP